MDARELFKKGQQLFIEGRHRESIDAFTASIEAGEETEIAYLSRGVAYLKSEQIDRAIEDFTRVIEMNNKNMRAFYYRGIAYLIKEDYEKAISDLDRTIELKPDHGAAFFARGAAYAQTGNEYEAARNIKTAIGFSEASLQSFTDTFGIFRTQFDRAMTIMTEKGLASSSSLTQDEIELVKKWLNDKDH